MFPFAQPDNVATPLLEVKNTTGIVQQALYELLLFNPHPLYKPPLTPSSVKPTPPLTGFNVNCK